MFDSHLHLQDPRIAGRTDEIIAAMRDAGITGCVVNGTNEKDWPAAAASLREGLDETFTINDIGLPGRLRRCLATTNRIESPGAGVRLGTRRVCNWKDGKMVLRWPARAYLATEKRFRRIMGHEQLWMLKSYLDRNEEAAPVAAERKVG